MPDSPKEIFVNGENVALFIPNISTEKRIEFFTDPKDQLQIAAFDMKEGETIQPHIHLQNVRKVNRTVEIIFVQSGQMTVTFHESEESKKRSKIVVSHTLKVNNMMKTYRRSSLSLMKQISNEAKSNRHLN